MMWIVHQRGAGGAGVGLPRNWDARRRWIKTRSLRAQRAIIVTLSNVRTAQSGRRNPLSRKQPRYLLGVPMVTARLACGRLAEPNATRAL
jgi:hypothetical protein